MTITPHNRINENMALALVKREKHSVCKKKKKQTTVSVKTSKGDETQLTIFNMVTDLISFV